MHERVRNVLKTYESYVALYSVRKAGRSAAYDSNGLTFWCWAPSDVSVDEIISMKVDILRAVSLETRSVTRITPTTVTESQWTPRCSTFSWRSCPEKAMGRIDRGSSLPFLILGALACLDLTVHSLCNCTLGSVHSILRLIYCHKTFGVISSRNGKRMPYL